MNSRGRNGSFWGMRNLIITQNITLDGVIDAAGGWFDVGNDADLDDVAETLREHSADSDALLVGRSTFESFRAFWPNQTDDETGVREHLNRVHKYVVSSTLTEPGWEPTTVLRHRRHRGAQARAGARHRLHRQPHARAGADRARTGRRVPAVRRTRSCSSEGSAARVVVHAAALLVAAAVDHGREEVAADGLRAAQEPLALRVRSRPASVRATRSGPVRTARAPGGSSTCLYATDGCARSLPARLPGRLQLGRHRRGRRGGAAAGQPRAPVHGRARCARRSTATSSTRARRTGCCTRCGASARRAPASSSGSRGTRRWPRSPRGCTPCRDEFGGEAIWPFQGTGSLGYLQGLEGRAGQRLWNVLGASRHDMTICSIAGRVGATYVTGTAAGMDPETFAQSKLILLWGTNTLTSGHHLWKFVLAARKQRRAHRRHRSFEDPHRRAGRRAPRAVAGHRRRARARAAERDRRAWTPRTTRTWPRTRSAGRRSASASSSSRRRGSRRSPGSTKRDRRARAADRDHAADRHPLHDGHAAPRRRRQRAATAVRASRA